MSKKYSSKISYGLLIFVFLVFYGPVVLIVIREGFNKQLVLLILFLSIFFTFILYLFFKTEYTIQDNKLKIKCGFFSYKPIEIADIKEISKTNNIISSPAASLDRIEIKYGKFNEIIISPKNKVEFAQYLTQLNPKIKNNITNN